MEKNKIKIYLAGEMDKDNIHIWRKKIIEDNYFKNKDKEVIFLYPEQNRNDIYGEVNWRGESQESATIFDLKLIDNSDFIFCRLNRKELYGSLTEIMYANSKFKRIVIDISGLNNSDEREAHGVKQHGTNGTSSYEPQHGVVGQHGTRFSNYYNEYWFLLDYLDDRKLNTNFKNITIGCEDLISWSKLNLGLKDKQIPIKNVTKINGNGVIAAIPTDYNGIKFRSRLEAKWAYYFDLIGLKWEFEPEGYKLSDGTYYLPDFEIKGFGYVEIKPDSIKGKELEEAKRKCKLLAESFDVMLCIGSPGLKCQTVFSRRNNDSCLIDENEAAFNCYSVKKWDSEPYYGDYYWDEDFETIDCIKKVNTKRWW